MENNSVKYIKSSFYEVVLVVMLMGAVTLGFLFLLNYDFDGENNFWAFLSKNYRILIIACFVMYFFSVKPSKKVQFVPSENEKIQTEGYAYFQKNIFASFSGKIFLTDRKIIFKSFKKFWQKEIQLEFPLEEIQDVKSRYILGFIPNGIAIKTHSQKGVFYSFNQKMWTEELVKNENNLN